MYTIFELPATPRSYLVFAGLCFLLALLTFGSLREHQFEMDDNDYLHDAEIALKVPSHLLSADRYVACRPVVDLIFIMTHAVWGSNPANYHLLMAALHFVSSMVLFWTFRVWQIDFELSAFATLLFLMHVGHFRAVHWISCLAYPVALIFSLLVLIHYRRFLETGDYRCFVIAIVFLNLAILSHASSSAVVLCILYFAYRKGTPVREIILQALLLGFIAVGLVWLLSLLSVNTPQAEHGLDQTDFLSILYSWYWFTGRLYAFAFWLPRNIGGVQISDMVIGALVIVMGIWSIWRHRGAVSDWVVWSLALMLPFTTDHHSISHAQEHWVFGPSRYLYLASAGSSFVLAWLIRQVVLNGITSLKIKKWLFASFTTVILILCSGHWRKYDHLVFV
ncbi:MAG: hypothetical protein O7G87_12415 [bacterium]|nr:hypothetical protein [bacterium]